MRRARQTCALVLEECDPLCTLPHQLDHRLGEKSFGVFAGQNINLLRMTYGRKVFERLTASGMEQPPAAEPLSEVYARVAEFYEERVKPLTDAGKNVLVVSHQYALEPLALYLSGKGPEEYAGALDLPNGKAMSVKDMTAFQAHHAHGLMKNVKHLRDAAMVDGMNYVAAAALFGMILKWAIARRMPTTCFTVLIVLALAVSSFYTYLDVNVAASFANTPKRSLAFTLISWLCRLGICIPIASRVVTQQQFMWVLLCMVPPALTAPVMSVLWGGGKYLCVCGTILLYLSIPPVLAVLPYCPGYIYDNKAMTLFYVVLGAGLLAPAAAAQVWRARSPVDAAKHRKEWSFLSVYAVVALSFLGVYQVTPATRGASVLLQMFYPFKKSTVAALENERAFFQGVATYMAMKAIPAATRKVWVYLFGGAPDQAMDWYILHTSPNIFLWLGLANSVKAPPDETYVKFWAVLFFFIWPAVEQNFIVKSFMHKLLRRTTQSKHISLTEMDVVWSVLKSSGAVCIADDGEEGLDKDGVVAFAAYVQQLTTGIVDEAPPHVTETLFATLDTDNSGFVTKSELYVYVSSVGLVIDLNGSRQASRVAHAAATSTKLAAADSARLQVKGTTHPSLQASRQLMSDVLQKLLADDTAMPGTRRLSSALRSQTKALGGSRDGVDLDLPKPPTELRRFTTRVPRLELIRSQSSLRRSQSGPSDRAASPLTVTIVE